jgi:hypothetical protein
MSMQALPPELLQTILAHIDLRARYKSLRPACRSFCECAASLSPPVVNIHRWSTALVHPSLPTLSFGHSNVWFILCEHSPAPNLRSLGIAELYIEAQDIGITVEVLAPLVTNSAETLRSLSVFGLCDAPTLQLHKMLVPLASTLTSLTLESDELPLGICVSLAASLRGLHRVDLRLTRGQVAADIAQFSDSRGRETYGLVLSELACLPLLRHVSVTHGDEELKRRGFTEDDEASDHFMIGFTVGLSALRQVNRICTPFLINGNHADDHGWDALILLLQRVPDLESLEQISYPGSGPTSFWAAISEMGGLPKMKSIGVLDSETSVEDLEELLHSVLHDLPALTALDICYVNSFRNGFATKLDVVEKLSCLREHPSLVELTCSISETDTGDVDDMLLTGQPFEALQQAVGPRIRVYESGSRIGVWL